VQKIYILLHSLLLTLPFSHVSVHPTLTTWTRKLKRWLALSFSTLSITTSTPLQLSMCHALTKIKFFEPGLNQRPMDHLSLEGDAEGGVM
jgi:hypothetical protein